MLAARSSSIRAGIVVDLDIRLIAIGGIELRIAPLNVFGPAQTGPDADVDVVGVRLDLVLAEADDADRAGDKVDDAYSIGDDCG